MAKGPDRAWPLSPAKPSVFGMYAGPSGPAARRAWPRANQIRALVGSARALGHDVELFTKRQAKSGVLSLKRYPGTILNT